MPERVGRPRKYQRLIDEITVADGWVAVCEQKARTAAPGFAQRYPGYLFRSVPNTGEGKPYILQARLKEGGDG